MPTSLMRAVPLLLLLAAGAAASTGLLPADRAAYARSHDLRAPDWGPYSNAYLGISHLTDPVRGLRFDISLFAGGHTTTTPSVPNASLNTGMVAWDASPDLNYYAYRQRIDGARLYAELSYAGLSAHTRVLRANLVNRGARARTITLNLVASLQLPNRHPNAVLQPRRILVPVLPDGARWINGVHYSELQVAAPTAQDRLVYDGRLRGEERDDGMVDGRALRLRSGDKVCFEIGARAPDAVMVLRYRAPKGATLLADGLDDRAIELAAGEDWRTAVLPLASAARELRMRHGGGHWVEINGMAIVPAEQAAAVRFEPEERDTTPEIIAGPVSDSVLLKYRQSARYYGLRWYRDPSRVRQFRNGVLDVFFARNSMAKTRLDFDGDGAGHYTNVHFGGKPVPPRGSETIWALATEGSRVEVEAALRTPLAAARAAHRDASLAAAQPPRLPAGARYDLARQLIRANLLMNVVYPVYTQDQFIRHFTPGKWWDSLYTWDSGFLGLGMAAVAPRLSVDVLNAYTTAPGAQSAFIHHGTPLPVQHTQFLELWNRTQDRALLEYAYPRLRQYYEFLVGRAPSSSTAHLASGLLSSWDYFYNSGGWDDYPAQVAMHEQGLASRTAPMVTSSHAVRAARILRMAALEMGRQDDVAGYDADIARLSAAVQVAWDPQAGYFGYVLHDGDGRPVGLLRTKSGENFNRGLDGVQPLVAGIADAAQTRALLAHLTTPGQLWSPIGLTAVDQRAGYYDPQGYWNGTVWFPHQYFIWKTLLDLGRSEQAWTIARTALTLYQREAADSWTSAEHFEIATGQGVGWHQFSGLSAPIANWYASYFELGSLTAGYDVWIRARRWDGQYRRLDAELALYPSQPSRHSSVLAVAAPGRYRATWNGAPVPVRRLDGGALSITLPSAAGIGTLALRRIGD